MGDERPRYHLSHWSGEYTVELRPVAFRRRNTGWTQEVSGLEFLARDYLRGEPEVRHFFSRVLGAVRFDSDHWLDESLSVLRNPLEPDPRVMDRFRAAVVAGRITFIRAKPKIRETVYQPREPAKKAKREKKQDKLHSIRIVLRDKEGKPVPNSSFEIKLPDGKTRIQSTNTKGERWVHGIPAGACDIRFLDYGKDKCKQNGSEALPQDE